MRAGRGQGKRGVGGQGCMRRMNGMREGGMGRRQVDDPDPRGVTQITTPNALNRSMHLHVESRALTWEQHSTHATRGEGYQPGGFLSA